ncbi:MAG TPA: peptidoglycan-binding protein [Chthoniobacterales bacterium]|nr:peptidoglycan-binding protein [Chthoniobacterales bacterium]
MKNLLGIVVVVTLIGLSGNAVAKSGGNSDSPPPPAPVHHGSSAPATAPVGVSIPHPGGGGVPHNFSSQPVYRPTTTVNGSGQRTLVYPGVRNSTIRHPTNLNTNAVRTGGQAGSGKLHSPSGIATINKAKLDPQTSTRLRNWNGNRSTTAQAQQINAANHHHHHDHNWWKHHCVTFIFFDWGWWGWDDGWWYPAWGYAPYSNYEYTQPIYGYGDFTPDQIVAGVQTELQRQGYYTYAIDGKMGPLTRSALARYQSDHRMNITSGIDSATLNSLGIIH